MNKDIVDEGPARVERRHQQTIITPVPDPTFLTTDQLRRELQALKELMFTRLDATDKAVILKQSQADLLPGMIDDKMEQLKRLHDEKFTSIQTQFKERDVRTEQSARDSKVAVDAALQAAKEAVGEQNKSSALAIAKSETATTKQIDQIFIVIEAMRKGLDDKIDDMKERLTSLEGQKKGMSESWGVIVGFIGILIGVAALVLRMKG